MAEKTTFEHIEFKSFGDVKKYYRAHKALKTLPEDSWEVVRVQYSANIYDEYYVFAVVDKMNGRREITAVNRAIVLVKNCTLAERQKIDEILVVPQPGKGEYAEDENPIDETDSVDLEDDFGGGHMPVELESLAEVKKHFESQVSGVDDWAIYRFADEFEAYPDCHVFVAIDHSKEEVIDIPWAVLLKSKCSEADDFEIMEFPLIDYGDDESDDEDDESVDASGDDDGPDDDTEPEPTPEVKTYPTYDGHTLH